MAVCRDYYRLFHLPACPVDMTGRPLLPKRSRGCWPGMHAHGDAIAACLQEALHWGEPYIFYRTTGILSWIIAMVDGGDVAGGILGGEVLAYEGAAEDALRELLQQGIAARQARRYVDRLPLWPAARIREAAWTLSNLFYQISGWQPALLDENRLKAQQQRQIAEAMDAQRKQGAGTPAYPLEKERLLLSLIKAGDRNGARRVLNETLGAMFLFSPKLVVLRARAIEMMGYLIRAAIEDDILMEPLLEQNHQWMRKLIAARDFETLAHVLMKALDSFMDGIYRRSHGGVGHHGLQKAIEFIQANFTAAISLNDAAQAAGLSTYRLSHLFKHYTGRTFLQHLTQCRIRHAEQMLEQTTKSCAEIAYAAGFCDQSYFIKQFRRLQGVTPARYRRQFLRHHGYGKG